MGYGLWASGTAQHRGSLHTTYPAVPGSDLTSEITNPKKKGKDYGTKIFNTDIKTSICLALFQR